MARQKKVLPGSITKDVAEEAFADYASADAKRQKITSTMDVQMTKIREKYASELAALDDERAVAFDKLQAYAESNRDAFGKKKSLEFSHGILGFRTGTPKLKTKRGYTWASVTNLLKEFYPSYLRVSEEPAKDRLLGDRDDPSTLAVYEKVGIFVDQDETFYVEPKKEEDTVLN